MSENQTSPPANASAPNAAVIRRLEAAEETSQERLVKKHVPAWVVSGAVHVAIIALMILFLGGRSTTAKDSQDVVVNNTEATDDPEDPNLVNEHLGLDSRIEAALPELHRLEEQTIQGIETQDPIGQPDVPTTDITAYTPPGIDVSDLANPGAAGNTGNLLTGMGGANGRMAATYEGRSAATRSKLVAEGGGNAASERAVALALAWLAKQQKPDGGWEFDAGRKERRIAATGLALLPFLAAGETHKPGRSGEDRKYQKVVNAGLGYLMKNCPPSGPNAGRMSDDMYEQGIATIPLCEAFGMTKDPVLKVYAQAAINFIQRSQGPNGSWGYAAGQDGDTSIVGWQIQALTAAKLTKDLVVDNRVIDNAIKFLNLAGAGSRKSMYGYRDSNGAQPGTARTAIGLLCRYYIDGWGPNHPGLTEGVAGLLKVPPLGEDRPIDNLYYYYYATQVVHFAEGDAWKDWNEGPKQADGSRKGGMRDWLVDRQLMKGDAANIGSWEPERSWFGSGGGRLATTAVACLTLEVYYRHLPLYKRGADGNAIRVLEDK